MRKKETVLLMGMPRAVPASTYVLVTAAYNEEKYIERVIAAVLSQSVLPKRWIIVSDASSDRTDEIVRNYAEENPFIELVRIAEDHARNFAAQVNAINVGMARCCGSDYEFIGNLDADVSFEADYFERLLAKFEKDPHLGLAGGDIWEEAGGHFRPRYTNNPSAVAHAVQLFRRRCFESLGGYTALPYGGPDSHAEVLCRMNGWHVRSHDDLPVFHHRPCGGAGHWASAAYRQGLMDYSLGIHPGFEILRLLRRVFQRPYGAYAIVRLFGFIRANWDGGPRPVSVQFVRYLRSEQRDRMLRVVADRLSALTGRESKESKE